MNQTRLKGFYSHTTPGFKNLHLLGKEGNICRMQLPLQIPVVETRYLWRLPYYALPVSDGIKPIGVNCEVIKIEGIGT